MGRVCPTCPGYRGVWDGEMSQNALFCAVGCEHMPPCGDDPEDKTWVCGACPPARKRLCPCQHASLRGAGWKARYDAWLVRFRAMLARVHPQKRDYKTAHCIICGEAIYSGRQCCQKHAQMLRWARKSLGEDEAIEYVRQRSGERGCVAVSNYGY